jgi:hypothetical protein
MPAAMRWAAAQCAECTIAGSAGPFFSVVEEEPFEVIEVLEKHGVSAAVRPCPSVLLVGLMAACYAVWAEKKKSKVLFKGAADTHRGEGGGGDAEAQ